MYMSRRTLSDEFLSRSPNTQMYVRGMAMAIPTSKPVAETTNMKEFLSASPNTQQHMMAYGLVSSTILQRLLYITTNPSKK
jgi:hypothetical protein